MKEKKQHAQNDPQPQKDEQTVEESVKAEETANKVNETGDKEQELQKLEDQLSEQKDLYLRLAAEYDNYKKRTKREIERIGTDTRAEVIKNLLPALDNFMRVKTADQNSDEFKKGVEMSIKSFTDALEKLGVEEIECENAVFDPEIHYAVAQIEDENLDDNTIAQVMQKGYKMGDKVIRHAMVSVANCK